jgi:hypothetical protein
MRAILGGLADDSRLASVLPSAGEAAIRSRPVRQSVTTRRWRKQMVERGETSAVRFKQRLNPSRSCGANRWMRKVTGTSGSVEAARTSIVVHDVEGPIVTGVLGGD